MRKMKESGIEYMGLIPENWAVLKTIYVLAMPITDGPHTTPELFDEGIPFISAEAVGSGKIDFDHMRGYISEEFYRICCLKYTPRRNDIYMVKSGATTGRVAMVETDEIFTIWSPLAVFRADEDKVLSRFLFYAVQSPSYTRQVEHGWSFGTQQNIGMRVLEDLKICLPPMEDQISIVKCLDENCSKIDSIITDIQAQIDVLELYKQSVITESVTKGLKPELATQNSEIDWIGQVPPTWDSYRGKYIFTQRSLRGNQIELQLLSPTQKYGVIPQALYEDLSGMGAVKLSDSIDLAALKTIHKGDFCISLRSFQGGFEYSEYEGVVSPAYQVFYPTLPIVDGYYRYLFKERGFIEKMNSYTMTLRDGKNIAFSDFGNTYIPYPPLEEQAEIAMFLDDKCSQIDGVISEKKNQLEIVNDYKKSLIFEYVTGKKECPV